MPSYKSFQSLKSDGSSDSENFEEQPFQKEENHINLLRNGTVNSILAAYKTSFIDSRLQSSVGQFAQNMIERNGLEDSFYVFNLGELVDLY